MNMNMNMKIYVASSWRNDHQPDVVRALRKLGYDVYDFKFPLPEDTGFSWGDIAGSWQNWTAEQFIEGLKNPIAERGFKSDWDAMTSAHACVLVLPCGRSAHLEAGYFVGAGKPLLILMGGEVIPELMYKMADSIHLGLGSLLTRLQEIRA